MSQMDGQLSEAGPSLRPSRQGDLPASLNHSVSTSNLSAIQQRKTASLNKHLGNADIGVDLVSRQRKSRDILAEKQRISNNPSDKAEEEARFLHGTVLTLCLVPSFLIMIAFGGALALQCLCFGAVLAYIFDVLGSVEGTLFAILFTGLAIWTSLVWTARLLLQDSIFNFSIVLIMGLLLIFVFLVCASSFRAARLEFDTSFYFFETLMFATLPLLGSCITSWFIFLEGGLEAQVELSVLFTISYYAYLLFLFPPRPSSAPSCYTRPVKSRKNEDNGSSINSNDNSQRVRFVLRTYTLQLTVLLLPIFLAPLIYIASNHWMISAWILDRKSYILSGTQSTSMGFKKLGGLIGSFLLPLLGTVLLSEEHFDNYWNRDKEGITQKYEFKNYIGFLKTSLEALKMISIIGLFFCIESHPLLDDIKGYSGLSDRKAGMLICSIGVFFSMALVQYKRGVSAHVSTRNVPASVNDSSGRSGMTVTGSQDSGIIKTIINIIAKMVSGPFIPRTLVTLCLGAAGCLCGMLLRFQYTAYPLLGAAIIGMSEYYQRWKDIRTDIMNPPAKAWIVWAVVYLLVSAAATCLSLVIMLFCQQTIYYLDLQLVWFEFGPGGNGGVRSNMFSNSTTDGILSAIGLQWLLDEIIYPLLKLLARIFGLGAIVDSESFDEDEGVSIQVLCQLVVVLVNFAISIPTLSLNATTNAAIDAARKPHNNNNIVMNRGLGEEDVSISKANSSRVLFSTSLVIFSVFVAILELLLREQRWEKYGLHVENVYPSSCLLLTGALFSITAWRLGPRYGGAINQTNAHNDGGRIDINSILVIILCQITKIFHLWGLPAQGCASLALTLIIMIHPVVCLVYAPYSPTNRPLALILYAKLGTLILYLAYRNISEEILTSLIGRTPTDLQTLSSVVTIWAVFQLVLLQGYANSPTRHERGSDLSVISQKLGRLIRYLKTSIQSFLMVIAVVGAMLTTESFGPIVIRFDSSVDSYLVIEKQLDTQGIEQDSVDQAGLYLILTLALLLLAGSGAFPVRHFSGCLIFIFLLSYLLGQTMQCAFFPLAMGRDSPQYGFFEIPSVYCHLSALFIVITGLLAVLPLTMGINGRGTVTTWMKWVHSPSGAAYAPWTMVLSCVLLPLLAMIALLLTDSAESTLRGVLAGAAVLSGALALIMRLSEIVVEVQQVREKSKSVGVQRNTGWRASASHIPALCAAASMLAILWTIGFTSVSSEHAISHDLVVPISGLSLLCTRKGIMLNTPSRFSTSIANDSLAPSPLMLVALVSSTWWIFRGLSASFSEVVSYGIFGEEVLTPATLRISSFNQGSFFHDENVSFWSANSVWTPVINLILLILPLPGIWIGYARSVDDSEDGAFILACVSCLAMIGGVCGPVRYLGVIGACVAAWRWKDIGDLSKAGNRLI